MIVFKFFRLVMDNSLDNTGNILGHNISKINQNLTIEILQGSWPSMAGFTLKYK